MWLMLNDAFFSIVNKDCAPGELLVRARRRGDIEKVFGRHCRVDEDDRGDYLFRARVLKADIVRAVSMELEGIDYPNFKDSVQDPKLSKAYLNVWDAMSRVQPSMPYAGSYRGAHAGLLDGLNATLRPGKKRKRRSLKKGA